MRSTLRKYCLVISLVLLGLVSPAQNMVEIAPIEFWNFDHGLIPAQSIYGNSWDHSNVDSPRFNQELVKWGFLLDLVEDDCQYVHPVKGVITSNFGWRRGRMHKGIDINLDIGDPVYAAFDGIIRINKYNAGGYGNYVVIRHYNGVETLYGHLSESVVVNNQTVRAGQIIGFGGSTGRSTGPHLHFETRFLGQAFNPKKIIDFAAETVFMKRAYLNHTWFSYLPKTLYTASGSYNRPVPKKSSRRYHTIRRGDTLYGLSRKYGTSVNTICRLNGISRSTTLRIGRKLRVR
jgi:murein DD-endopeptidase MepM/ murein hydrolase activator NlpD